ncbi:UNVERIFIED_CONTAM: hypothetical protein OHV15_00650 [Microbacterium sp. SLM126]
MEIDWQQLIWDGRWTALEMLWNAVLVNIATHWWFGPLLAIVVVGTGWKGISRFAVYIARVFGHTHGL